MTEAAPLFSVSGLEKNFDGGVRALRNVNLHVDKGEFVTLLGPSGCGKSTLLRLVANLMQPDAGTIAWPENPVKGSIGVVFQDPTLMPWLTVAQNVETPLRIAGIDRAQRQSRALDSLAWVRLNSFANAYPRTLSGGMKMRVSIARALVTRPSVLLLDEPFAALDEFTRQQLNDDLLEIRRAMGVSILFVTHSTAEAVYLSDRILIMSARPGTILRETRVQAPERRTEAFRHSPEFANQCGAIARALRDAMVTA